jgi:hypothetical protein
LHSRPMPFQQRTNTSWRSIGSQPADSRRLFRCLGAHLLRSPSIVKFVSLLRPALSSVRGHTTPVPIQSSSSPISVSRQKTSPGCRFVLVHRSLSLSFILVSTAGKQKPCLHTVSRVKKSGFRFRYLLTSRPSKFDSGPCPRYTMDRPNAQPRL